MRRGQLNAVAVGAGNSTGRTKFSFRITVEGIMLLVVILLVGFAAWHSGTNLLYLIFSILVAFYLVHGFILSLNLHSLRFTEEIPQTVVAKQPFDVKAVLINRKRWFPSYAVRLSFRSSGTVIQYGSVFFPVVPGRESRMAFTTVMLPVRGLHSIKLVSISTRYPFGFEERTQTHTVNRHILALPPTYGVAGIVANIPFGFGDQESNIRGAGTDLYGLRDYIPGEHARHVHWRTSARLQKIMISEYTRDERRQVVLLLNNGVSVDRARFLHNEFENAVILTASLAKHLIANGFEVGLSTAEDELPVGQGSSHLLAIMRHLALLKMTAPLGIRAMPQTILQVLFHDEPENSERHAELFSIDSRTWNPPQETLGYGEKLL